MKKLVFVLITSLALISVAMNIESRTLTDEEVVKLYCEYDNKEFIEYRGADYSVCTQDGNKERFLNYTAINKNDGHTIWSSVNEEYARYVVKELSNNK